MVSRGCLLKFMACGLLLSWTVPVRAGFDRSKFIIGTYCLRTNACTEAHIADMKAAGIDFVWAKVDRTTLDLMDKHGIGCVMTGVIPDSVGGCHKGHVHEVSDLARVDAMVDRFVDHPAIWGVNVGDEPNAVDFPHIGKVVRRVQERLPGKFPSINLNPIYGTTVKQTDGDVLKSDFGTETYADYIREYVKHVPTDYISEDHYPWGWRNMVSRMHENNRILGDACLASGRDFWVVLQANAHTEKPYCRRSMTEGTMRFQAYSAMAYGAVEISWACWCNGWWAENAIDTNGVKTATYHRIKNVNRQIRAIAKPYMMFRRVATDLVGFKGDPQVEGVNQVPVDESQFGCFSGIRAKDGLPLAVGKMVARDGSARYGLFIAACDDPEDEHPRTRMITFNPNGREVRAFGGEGGLSIIDCGDGLQAVTILSNEAVMLVSR